jgi:hypothetical protein
LAENFYFIVINPYEIFNLISSMNINDDNDLIEEIRKFLRDRKIYFRKGYFLIYFYFEHEN